jgi:transcription initiation factor IIE alpha subunit
MGLRMDAAKRGEKRFIGSPCRVCGSALRRTDNGACIECLKRHSKVYREKFKAALIEANSQKGG